MKRLMRPTGAAQRKALMTEPLESRQLLAADVVITELLAKNETGLRDEDGDRTDWIEIANLGEEAADLSGWSLTDDAEQPRKWLFPPMTLDPGTVQIVFASDKDRRESSQPLHTNFKLDRDGEYLALVDAAGTARSVYQPFPAQRTDVSYGVPGANAETTGARYFRTPSPGELNAEQGFAGFLDGVDIDVSHGFYEAPQTVTLRTRTPGASLAYRLDGADPTTTTANAEVVRPANEESLVTFELLVDTTSVVRVAEVMSDHLPSSAQTQSYLFVSDIVRQSPDGDAPTGWPSRSVNGQLFDYGMDPDVVDDPEYAELIETALLDLPSFSIVMDPQDIFDPERGFFVNGERSRDNPRAWERATSLELIHPDDSEGFQIDAGIRMRGGFSRRPDNAKHAFRLFFRDEYGDGQLNYPLFDGDGAQSFENIDLRTAQVPSWSLCWPGASPTGGGCQYNTFLRDVFARDLQQATGQPTTRSRFYHLYLNGQYWGLFQTQERPEASYGASYFGGDEDDYDVIKVESFPHNTVATDGNLDAWRELWEASVIGFADDTHYRRVQGLDANGERNTELPVLLDVDNLIDYMLVTLYTGNLDGPISNFLDNESTNNWFAIYNRNGEQGFQFFVHDSEWILFDVNEDRNGPWPAGRTFSQSNPQWLHQQLMQNGDYRLRFADRAERYLFDSGVMTSDAVVERLDQRAAEIDLAIIAESARWGDTRRRVPYTKEDWLSEVDRLRERIVPARTSAVIEQLRDTVLSDGTPAPLLPSINAPQIQRAFHPTTATQFQGVIVSEQTVYYTTDGSDPREHASSIELHTLVEAGAEARYHVPTDGAIHDVWRELNFDDDSWESGPTGIGFDRRGNSFPDQIATNVDEAMRTVNSSIYLRLPFEIDDVSRIDVLNLSVMFDDGFVAYLNGKPVARAFADEQTSWDSRATDTRSTADSTRFVGYDISEFVSQLQVGSNVLAIQALNRTASGSDFLILPKLEAGTIIDIGLSATAQRFAAAIALDSPTTLRARAWSNGEWSALAERSFPPEFVVGDVNGDGLFDSSDLVSVFQRGEYEDDLLGNSSWFDGDWTGDAEFSTSDLVLAFQMMKPVEQED